MERLDFYKLTRPVQERLIGSINGTGLPKPILERRVPPREPFVWLLGSAVALLGLLATYRAGLGDLTDPHAIHSTPMYGLYAALAAAAAFALLRALALWGARRALPFRPGIYVFPVGLVDARHAALRMIRIEDLTSSEGPLAAAGGAFRLVFREGGTFELSPHGDPAEATRQLQAARGQMEEADHARDSIRPKALAALDPLHGVATPLVSSVPITRKPPLWARLDWAFAIVLGALLGFALWAVHNAKSDDAMFQAAAAANDVPSLRAYLAQGTRHHDEAAHVLLPRAELRDAVQAGTVDAIEAYIHDHPQTGIAQEITAALRAALAAELAKAREVGTLAALDDFAHRHPEHHLDADLAAARHAVFAAGLAHYASLAPAKDPTALAFVERLLASCERLGPTVSLRFRRVPSKSFERADGAVGKSPYFNGVVSLASRYFDAAHARPREAAFATALIARFQEVFGAELCTLTQGPPLDDADPAAGSASPPPPAPAVTAPLLEVGHLTDWTGGTATNTNPRGVYLGLGFTFSATFRLPDDGKPRAFRNVIYRSPEVSLGKGADKPEETVYEAMAKDSFDVFRKRYEATLFR